MREVFLEVCREENRRSVMLTKGKNGHAELEMSALMLEGTGPYKFGPLPYKGSEFGPKNMGFSSKIGPTGFFNGGSDGNLKWTS